MRSVLATIAALLVGTPVGALAQYSPISPKDSTTIRRGAGDPDVSRAERLEEKESVEPQAVRDAVRAGNWKEALELIRRSVAEEEDDAEKQKLRLIEARILARMGETRPAVLTYRRLLDDGGVGTKARAELHAFYVGRGEFASADRLTEPPEDGPPDPQLAILRAYARSVQGRYTEAARLAGEAALRGDPEARVLRANALLALGDQDEAEALYLQVLRESKDRSARQIAHFGLGQVARLRGGRAVRALQDERAVRLGAAPWAELDWGLSLRSLGRIEEARERLTRVVEENAALESTARLALSRLEEEDGLRERGLESLVSALEGGSGDFLVLTRLGELLVKDGREDQGIEAYRAALLLLPEFPVGRELLTRALTSRGRWDEVPPPVADGGDWELPGWTWDRLLDGDLPYFPVVADRDSLSRDDPRRFVLALVHLRAGNPGAVLGWTEGVDARSGPLACLRAEGFELAGRAEDAITLWEEILDEGEGGPLAREHLARLLFDTEPDRALSLWRDLFVRYPEFPRARLRMARLLEDAGQLQEAREAYEQAESAGWFSPGERHRIQVAKEDLEDLIQEQEEEALDIEG